MGLFFTKHAKKRMKQRGVGNSATTSASRGTSRYQGHGIYKSEIERRGIKYVVVYKRDGAKKVIISTWRKQ
ncbi:MAG: hypothetical protein Q7S57_01885 [bacterium]|nr:hypothetical protein [bacterium]